MPVSFAGISLRNPVVLAAGTCGYIDEMSDVMKLSDVGGLVTKSITVEPRSGNKPERIRGTSMGMLNAIGLANIGLKLFVAEKLPLAASCDCAVFGSIAGNSIDDYIKVAAEFDKSELLPAVELNVSCPNTGDGLVYGESPQRLSDLLKEVRPTLTATKLIVKLSPNAPSLIKMAEVAVVCGADGLGLINTFTALAIDPVSRRSRIANGTAGYSGVGIHPIAVRMVHDVYKNVAKDADVPILAYGGVMNWEDAAEFILAGASLVGMGTALFVDPGLPKRVAKGLEKWRIKQNVDSINDLTGQVIF